MTPTICIDYDGTFDRLPGLFARFILDARKCGCRVFIVSCRKCECTPETHCENHRDMKQFAIDSMLDCGLQIASDGSAVVNVLLTNGAPKRWFMEQRGIKVDIWIDDEPMTIEYGR